MSIASEIARLQAAKEALKIAINDKGGTITDETLDEYAAFVEDISGGGTTPADIYSQSIFTGATIPLTHKDNTIDYENNYVYKSENYNITITGLDGRATITNNGTKEVTVSFDVTSATSSLKNFTITCVDGGNTHFFNGMHAHYGMTLASGKVLIFAYKNITKDGSEGIIDTNYIFVVGSSFPNFPTATRLFESTIYSYQVLNILIGKKSGALSGGYFMHSCYSFNQPLTISPSITHLGSYSLSRCYSFNQPITFSSSATPIGSYFLESCFSFNQPLDLTNITAIGANFLIGARSFNQPVTIPEAVTTIGNSWFYGCFSFNKPLILPSSLSSGLGNDFLRDCYSFNQPITLPEGITSIGAGFLQNAKAFNKPIVLPSTLNTIGKYFLRAASAFNQPLTIPSVTSFGEYFLSEATSFNSKLVLPNNLVTIGSYFLYGCYAFNQPLIIPSSVTTVSSYFMNDCYAFNQPINIPSGVTSIGTYFLSGALSLSFLIWEVSVYPYDAYSLAETYNTKTSASGAGIMVYGLKRAELMVSLNNRTVTPFRKLIDGGS